MNLLQVRQGFLNAGLPQQPIDDVLDSYVEAKRRFHLGDHRPNAVEGGRFSEAVFRVLQQVGTGSYTPLGKSLPSVDALLVTLQNIPSALAPDSVRIHIPRTLRLIYDIRNKRDTAHLGDDIDPNLQDASLVVANMDWVMAELVRLYHGVTADEAQAIIDDLVTREVPVIHEIDGQPVILTNLTPRDQALLMLYRAGIDRGATLDELATWLRVKHKGNLKTRLRTLDEQKLALEHPNTGRFHITLKGARDVEERDLAKPA